MVKSPPPELGHLVRALNEAGGAYHHIDFGEGVALEGYYDLAPHLSLFDLPDEMEGLRVLDVGTFTGFLALECAARGAKVTAIDIHERSPVTDLAAILGLPVQYRQQSVFELAPGDGPYDLLVCGSLLLHLTDPVLALSRMRIVCGSALHVTTLCPKGRWRNRSHRCDFVGLEAERGGYYTYWSISAPALRKMLEVAGFSEVSRPRFAVLKSRPGRERFAVPHVALTARVRTAG
jgi:SAM-dependent methyltransferase